MRTRLVWLGWAAALALGACESAGGVDGDATSGVDVGTDAKAGSDSVAETDAQMDTAGGSDAAAASDVEQPDTLQPDADDAQLQTDAQAETDAAAQTDAGAATDAAAESDTAMGPDANPGTDASASTDAQSATDALAATDSQAGTDAQAGTDIQTGTDVVSGDAATGTDAVAGSDTSADVEPDAGAGSDAAAPTCVAAECDDGNPCTEDFCGESDTCEHTDNSDACDDGDPCTSGDACAAGKCGSGKSGCDDANPCTEDSCNPGVGCVHASLTGPCNDNSLCTLQDVCTDGVCIGTSKSCADGNQCTDDICAPLTGFCTNPVRTGACDDGNACTEADACAQGGCTGTAKVCNDANQCTEDSCGSDGTCQFVEVPVGCKDDDACTVFETCSNGTCIGQPLNCDDGKPCTSDSCDNDTGCVYTLVAGACSDGNACTEQDTCAGSLCVGSPLNCDDSNPCTSESCDPLTGCLHAANTLSCNDNDACTATDVCKDKACAGQMITCNDDNPCTSDSCNPSTGCVFTANQEPCSDDNACTTDDVCALKACKGTSLSCDDNNPCTTDSCSPTEGCQHAAANAACSDNDACTVNDACVDTVCKGGVRNCDDGSPCTSDSCQSATGCVYTAVSNPCTDGEICTLNDACDAGACKGSLDPCDDNNPCTTDSCASGVGCKHANNTATCNDGSACTKDDGCALGSCVGTTVVCSDSAFCTDDYCDSQDGCIFEPRNGDACDDGSKCTSSDACSGAQCVGAPVNCDDNNSCTTDSCDPASGCKHVTLANGASCDDGSGCTLSDQCKNGTCKGSPLYGGGTFGGAAFDEVTAMTATSTGGVVSVAATRSLTLNTWDSAVALQDKAGATVWSLDIPGAGDDRLESVAVTATHVWAVGYTTTTGAGGKDGWVVRLDLTTGTKTLDLHFGGDGDDELHQIVVRGSELLAVGYTTDNATDSRNGWLLRLDANGSALANLQYGTPTIDEEFSGLAYRADAIAMVGGKRDGCCNMDLWFVRTDAAGAEKSAVSLGDADVWDTGLGVVADGNAWLVGGTTAGGDTHGGTDAWLLRLADSGQRYWSLTYGGPGEDYAQGFGAAAGGVVFVGWNFEDGGAGSVVRLDRVGNLIWSENFGETAAESLRAFASTELGLWLGGKLETAGYDTNDALLMRVSHFGHFSCDEAGLCGGRPYEDCVDALACTADTCVPATGCSHPLRAENAPCDDGEVCTEGNLCDLLGQCSAGAPLDLDGDGHAPLGCEGDDCDDTRSSVHEGAVEICDQGAVDNDCSGSADLGPGGANTCECPAGWDVVAGGGGRACGAIVAVWGNRGATNSGYFAAQGDGTIIDSDTLLQWQAIDGAAVSWAAAETACGSLSLGGHSDWRLPTVLELQTVVDRSTAPGGVAAPFGGALDGDTVWADSVGADAAAWTVAFGTGAVVQQAKSTSGLHALCVRAGYYPAAAARFESIGSFVFDQLSGLLWSATNPASSYTLSAAQSYCRGLTLGGASWRLPTADELQGIVDFELAGFVPSSFTLQSGSYWTAIGAGAGKHWSFTFATHGWAATTDTSTARVHCTSGPQACRDSTECDDGDACTLDSCEPFSHTCQYEATSCPN